MSLIAKRYLILKTLGKGSQGAVYKVEDRQTKNIYALKEVYEDRSVVRERKFIERLIQIKKNKNNFLEKLIQISNQNIPDCNNHIVCYYDYFEYNNKFYIVMEYIDGMDLQQWSKRNYNVNSEEMVNIIDSVIRGIAYLHENGISHRDIKPANIIISNTGQVKIADFGITCVDEYNNCSNFSGTPNYIAPEIWKENYNFDNYITADIWSMGMTFYYLTNRRLPFTARNTESIKKFVIESKFESNAKFTPSNVFYGRWINQMISCMLTNENIYRPSIEELSYCSDNKELILHNNSAYIKCTFLRKLRRNGVSASIDMTSGELKNLVNNI